MILVLDNEEHMKTLHPGIIRRADKIICVTEDRSGFSILKDRDNFMGSTDFETTHPIEEFFDQVTFPCEILTQL